MVFTVLSLIYIVIPNFTSALTNLVHMSPILAMVIEALPHHTHDFREGHDIVGKIGDL